eukprot:12474168-Alexandrium_andersonii.AAC.1
MGNPRTRVLRWATEPLGQQASGPTDHWARALEQRIRSLWGVADGPTLASSKEFVRVDVSGAGQELHRMQVGQRCLDDSRLQAEP